MDTCGFINAIAAIIVVEFYSTHCRLVCAFSSVNKHTCPLAIISVPIDDSFNSQYLVNILTTFLQRFAYISSKFSKLFDDRGLRRSEMTMSDES